MPLSRKHGCLFIHIPRTGGVSIETALGLRRDAETEDVATLTGWIQSDELRQHGFVSPVLQHLCLPEVARLLPGQLLEELFIFAIVRNPWERVLSTYLFERKHHRHFHPEGENFPPLPDYLEQLNPFHRLQQSDFIGHRERQPDFVGRFENLAADFAHIAGRIGLESLQLPHLNRTRHEHYSTYYCAGAKQMVARLFGDDIERFGYRFEEA